MKSTAAHRALRTALAGGAAFVAATQSASALEAEAFAQKLKEVLATSSVTLEYDNATLSGDVVTLNEVEIEPEDGDELEFDNLVFTGVVETAEGGYTAEEARIPDIDVEEDDIRVKVSDLSMSAIEIPGRVVEGDPLASMVFYQQARSGPIVVTNDDEEVFRMEEFVIDVSRRPDESGIDTMLRGEDFTADLSAIEDTKARAAVEELGYEQISGRMSMNAGWTTATGELDLREYTLSVDDAGTLTIGANILGYTPEFITALQATQATQAMSEGSQEMAGMAMLGLMQQLSFNSASIRYEDAGLTPKALDYAGRQQGADGAQMAAAVKGMLPLFLGRLQNPAFQEQVSAAVNAFLDDPQSLTITADPEEPVAFTTLMGAAMGAPQTLPDVLNVTVTANE